MIGTTIRDAICTIYFWLIASVGVISSFVVCLVSYPFVDQKTFARIYEYVFCKIVMSSMSLVGIWSLEIKDKRDNKKFDGRYVVVANHASFIDTLVVAALPIKKKFIMAKIFTKIPIFGWLCKTSGHVMVDDKDKTTTKPAVELAVDAMKDGCSFFVYPEGKRSFDSKKLLPFKTGAFRIAQKTGAQVLPVAIRGTGKGMKMWGICKPAKLELIIGDPFKVDTHDSCNDTPDNKEENDEDNTNDKKWTEVTDAIERSRKFIQENL